MIVPADKVCFWDFDGTLGRRDGGWTGALCAVLRQSEPEHGFSEDRIRPHLEQGFPWLRPEVPHPHPRDPDLWRGALGGVFAGSFVAVGVGPRRARTLAQRVRTAYLQPHAWTCYSDSLVTLQALANLGWRQFTVSNHVPELPQILAGLGLLPYLEGIINSADVGHEKPHPRIFECALVEAGLEATAKPWMVGDSYWSDILGARRLGWRTVWLC